jgi:arsenite-transporting ATPase
MSKVEVYEPAMCCSTGLCTPNPDQALVDFAADVDWITSRGGVLERHNLVSDPESFLNNDTVKAFLQLEGQAGMPLVLVDGVTVLTGGYPKREQLARWTGVGASRQRVDLPLAAASECCEGSCDCTMETATETAFVPLANLSLGRGRA